MEITTGKYPKMPDLIHATAGFHHTGDSALEVLSDLHVSSSRISIRLAGRGWPSFWVVDQDPPPGTPLSPDVNISLSVEGLGFFHELPVGMWDRGNELEPGTKEIVELLDDPIQKAAHWIRQGALLFDVRPDNLQACSRWNALFGFSSDDWPVDSWYDLAVVLPNLHRLAGGEVGIRLALQLILKLPLLEIRRRRRFRYLEDEEVSLLAQKQSRLGVDLILGDRLEDLEGLTLVIGPTSLANYYEFRGERGRRLLEAVLRLCVPCYQDYLVDWLVLDPERAPRLGHEEENARLGINSHLGGKLQSVGVA